mmetsp:Transcript_13475/g.20501  ORF Transcript_13475/g.20501 Transcript_13475/m.20501 type:complete len:729 (+) Transcript_13475:104-2290(+)
MLSAVLQSTVRRLRKVAPIAKASAICGKNFSSQDIDSQNQRDTSNYSHKHQNTIGPFGSFGTEYHKSIADPIEFWRNAAKELEWFQFPEQILDRSNAPIYKWFTDGQLNACYNALDVNCNKGLGEQVALYYDSPVTDSKRSYTYSQLLDEVSRFAGSLVDLGVQKGDRVVIYMPMIPEAIVSMLACARIGAVHSVVFGGFASRELATRIDDCKPKIIISASCGVEPTRIVEYWPLLKEALQLANHGKAISHCIIVQRDNVHQCEPLRGDTYLDYHRVLQKASPHDAVPMFSTDPQYVLYTSGTTGQPKGICRDVGGHAVALKWSMGRFYNTNEGETFWAASDIGWVVGHSYSVYGPLMQGCSTVIYEGKPVGTPDAGAFWRVIEDYKVKTVFAAPTAVRAMRQADPDGHFASKYDLSSLQAFFLAGERADPDTLSWVNQHSNVPAIDHWWQTEIGFPGLGNALGLGFIPPKYGACAAPNCGYDVRILNADILEDDMDEIKVKQDDKQDESSSSSLSNSFELPVDVHGNIAMKLPLPPCASFTLYNDPDSARFLKEYIDTDTTTNNSKDSAMYYQTGDEGFLDGDGYVHAMGRTDDVINTAGHRLSTGAMEEVLLHHPDVAECAVIGVHHDIKGQVPIGFVTLVAGCSNVDHKALCGELIASVRKVIGPVAFFKKVQVVPSLPKTRSGKILRGTMRKIANGEEYRVTPTIEDAGVLEVLEPMIRELVEA